jgi:hypothetical protein
MPLTLTLSRGWRGKMKRKEFNSTPHFYSLPQGERRDEIKDFRKTPSPLPSPTGWRGKKEEEKNLTAPLTFVLSRKGRENLKEFI